MSTYNGEKYLEEQLESILLQTDVDFSILIRDDGSTDGTKCILQHYVQDHPDKITVITGDNIGCAQSFLSLIQMASDGFDYYAFADQDDVWKQEKLKRAVDVIRSSSQGERPVLYAGACTLVDKDLNIIEKRRKRAGKPIRPSFGHALVQVIGAGCTMVFNKELFQLLHGKMPRDAVMHDSWLYLVASAFGTVLVDSEPFIYYRQHESNTVGVPANLPVRIVRAWKHLPCFSKVKDQIRNLTELYELPPECAMLAERICKGGFANKIKILFDTRIHRSNKVNTFLYKLIMLTW